MRFTKRAVLLLPSILFVVFAVVIAVRDYGHLAKLNASKGNNLRFDQMLNVQPLVVLAGGVCFLILCLFSRGKLTWALLVAYGVFIIVMTLLYREPGVHRINMNPMEYLNRLHGGSLARQELINNIWLFLPIGILLGKLIRKPWVFLIPFLFSVGIELTQYITRLGYCDIVDVINNTLGGAVGILAGWGAETLVEAGKQKKAGEQKNTGEEEGT